MTGQERDVEALAGKGRKHRCPRCASTSLAVIENHEEYGETDFGEVLIIDGKVKPPGDFWFSPGEVTFTGFHCRDCDHQWRSRWPVGTFFEEDAR